MSPKFWGEHHRILKDLVSKDRDARVVYELVQVFHRLLLPLWLKQGIALVPRESPEHWVEKLVDEILERLPQGCNGKAHPEV